ncbi:glycosyltransferase [Leucobacter celer]|uniref:glycosyltransferase n=1 Tax=Leucobacter celer TaxID=668625 RepID=UPI0006A7DC43|nr:glycosyltransferase [Leucobacter celer]
MHRPLLLILSFSRIASDARLLKQIDRFSGEYRVVTCGYGPQPAGVAEHLEVSPEESRAAVLVRAACIRLRLFGLAYRVTPAVREGRRLLRRRRFDAVLANDLDTAGLALATAPGERVHLDLHEYWPGRQDQHPEWVRIRRPYYFWLLRRYARRARSATTVSDTIARRYRDEFGIQAGVVTNASPYRDLEPHSAASPLRLVHSGAALKNRRLESIMRAVAESSLDAVLDLYLMGEGTPYYDSLAQLADQLGDRVRLLPPVPHDQLLTTLNRYDVGIHVLPPTNTNNALALPNKFFDYVQARLALVIGPTASMAELLEEHRLGVVTDDFDVPAIARALDGLTVEAVREYQLNADAAAALLSAERQNEGWARAIAAIIGTSASSGDAVVPERGVDAHD